MALTQVFTAGSTLTATKLNESSIPVVSALSDITAPYVGQLVFNTTDSSVYRCSNAGTPTWVSLIGGPTWNIYRDSAQAVNNNSWTYINFDKEDTDTHNLHSTSVNSFAVTVSQAGLYAVTGKGGFVDNATGVRAVRLVKNGVVLTGSSVLFNRVAGNVASMATPTCYVQCAVNDVLAFQMWQNSGAALNTASGVVGNDSSGGDPTIFTGTWLRT